MVRRYFSHTALLAEVLRSQFLFSLSNGAGGRECGSPTETRASGVANGEVARHNCRDGRGTEAVTRRPEWQTNRGSKNWCCEQGGVLLRVEVCFANPVCTYSNNPEEDPTPRLLAIKPLVTRDDTSLKPTLAKPFADALADAERELNNHIRNIT